VPKTYRVRVARAPISERALSALRSGLQLEDGPTAPAGARRLRGDELELTIREGRNRQVRRMCDAVGHPVLALRRVAFGSLRLGALAIGEHRRLTEAELGVLRGAL
jgi:23S rRNA pseudouridine2605 synthase